MKYFNENMTYPEVLKALYTAVDGKNQKEIDEIKEEYKKVIPVITKTELSGPVNAMTSYKF